MKTIHKQWDDLSWKEKLEWLHSRLEGVRKRQVCHTEEIGSLNTDIRRTDNMVEDFEKKLEELRNAP